MAFTIHILGEAPIVVNDRMDAMYHLGAKYGAAMYNAAVRQGFIVFKENYVKVTPFNVKACGQVVDGISKGYMSLCLQ